MYDSWELLSKDPNILLSLSLLVGGREAENAGPSPWNT